MKGWNVKTESVRSLVEMYAKLSRHIATVMEQSNYSIDDDVWREIHQADWDKADILEELKRRCAEEGA